MLLAKMFRLALNIIRLLSKSKFRNSEMICHVTDLYVWLTVGVSAVRMFQNTFHKELYRNIVAGCLLTRISTVFYSVPVQAGGIIVSGEDQILGAFKKLRKETISLVASLHPSVCLRGTAGRPLDRFSSNLIFWIFFENLSENSRFIKI